MRSVAKDPCEVCTKEQAETLPVDFDGIHQVCPPGVVNLSFPGTAGSILRRGVGDAKRALLSGWVREQNNSGSVPMITSDVVENVLQRSPPPVADRAFALLKEAERGLSVLGAQFNINEPRFLSATYSTNQDDVVFFGPYT